MKKWISIRKIASVVLGVVCSAIPVAAQSLLANQMNHRAWTHSDGAPNLISDIAQTTDGYLWLATETGLVRFDGVRFERYTLPDGSRMPGSGTFSLLAPSDGSLWIGWRLHGVSELRNGVMRNYDSSDGLPTSTVYAIARDGRGRMWAASQVGLFLLDGNRWHRIGQEMNHVPDSPIGTPFVDTAGSLWITDEKQASVLTQGSNHFVTISSPLNIVSFAQDEAGAVWGFDHSGALSRLTGPGTIGRVYKLSEEPIRSDLGIFDHRGELWVNNSDKGLYRVKSFAELPDQDEAIPAQNYSTAAGNLSADNTRSLLEDHEGNIWVVTAKGLDRYRRNLFTSANLPSRFVNIVLLPSQGDSVLAGAMNQELIKLPGPVPAKSPASTPSSIASVYRDPDGVSWIGGRQAFWRLDRNGYTPIERPHKDFDVQAITTDGHGGLWVAIGPRWAYHYTGGQWLPYGNNEHLPKSCPFSAMTDTKGRVWFGYVRSQIAILDPSGNVKLITAKEGLDLGAISALYEHGDQVWAGGEKGLLRFSNEHFESIVADGERALHGISGIIERSNGDLWLNEADDIALIPASELHRAHSSPGYHVHVTFFDALDGLDGGAPQLRPIPTEIESDAGKLWFSLGSDAVWLDPDKIFHNTVPPPVDIQSVTVDGKTYRQLKNLKLQAMPGSIQIDYTALSLTIPERVLFRYKLLGVDRDWQQAGSRRQAFYTHLSPGTYRFTVLACNDDGLWNQTGTTLIFVVPPTITQTLWFKLLCICFAAFLLIAVLRWRLKALTQRAQAQISDRLVERERIARELHDTLLQGFQGLTLKFQNAATKISADHPARTIIDSALDRADQILVEGRNRVRDLRSVNTDSKELADSLRAIGKELNWGPEQEFHLEVLGTPREMQAVVLDEMFWIGREAILNAFSHAEAKRVECKLDFQLRHLVLRVVDDGRGINPEVLSSGKADHWGLDGMRERSTKITGAIRIANRKDGGVEVELKVPVDIAFLNQKALKPATPSWLRSVIKVFHEP